MSESSPVEAVSPKAEEVVKVNIPNVNVPDVVKVVSSEKSPTKIASNSESSKSVNESPKHTLEELNKMTIVNIKDIAKQLNILLSVSGKTKNKATLINDILQH